MDKPLRKVDLYTDGACSGNPGPGGWAAILKYGEHVMEISGNMPHTTNNRMELFAVISGLGKLKHPVQVAVHSDSSYVVNAFNQSWVENWQKNGWRTADKKPVENQDLWRLLLLTMRKHQVSFHKVPGHADHMENNRCDALAKAEVQALIKSLHLDEAKEETKASTSVNKAEKKGDVSS